MTERRERDKAECYLVLCSDAFLLAEPSAPGTQLS